MVNLFKIDGSLLKYFMISFYRCIDVCRSPESPIIAGGRMIIGAIPLWLHLDAKKKPGWIR